MYLLRWRALPKVVKTIWPVAYLFALLDIFLLLSAIQSGTLFGAHPALASGAPREIDTSVASSSSLLINAAVKQAMQAQDSATATAAAEQAVLTAAAATVAAAPTGTSVAAASAAQPPVSAIALSATDSTSAFTPDWYRCVILPESSNRAHVASGLFGILVSTWHDYGLSGVPGEYSPGTQAQVALQIYGRNGGFGPPAWNNHAHCA